MDRFWFHEIILFSEPIFLLSPKTLKTPQPTSETSTDPSSDTFLSLLPDQENSSDSSSISSSQEKNDSENEGEEKEIKIKEKELRLASLRKKCSQKRSKSLNYSRSIFRAVLEKSMSCKSLGELELEEVKGFMDLGFTFKKEKLCPTMMRVVPGLQRLVGEYKNKHRIQLVDIVATESTKEDDNQKDEVKRNIIMRPYLSEAWLIKRPNSPLLNLRIPSASAGADMKKHLKSWAKTVASVIQQES